MTTRYSIGYMPGILYIVLLQFYCYSITKLLHKIKLYTRYPHSYTHFHNRRFGTRPDTCELFIFRTIKQPFNRSLFFVHCPADSFGLICCPCCLLSPFFVLRFLFPFSARVRSFLVFSANGTQDGLKRAFLRSVYNFHADGQTDENGAIWEPLTG